MSKTLAEAISIYDATRSAYELRQLFADMEARAEAAEAGRDTWERRLFDGEAYTDRMIRELAPAHDDALVQAWAAHDRLAAELKAARAELSAALARVAELEAQAAQQWRPVTE